VGYYTGDLVRAGLDTPNTNLWHYVQLVRSGTLSGNEFLKEIQERKFGAILLDFDLKPNRDDAIANFTLTADFRAAILANYSLLAVLPMPRLEKREFNEGRIFLWVPRVNIFDRAGRSGIGTADTACRFHGCAGGHASGDTGGCATPPVSTVPPFWDPA
jgi:hypothetical protein